MVLDIQIGLTKKDIPYEGQIIRVADEFDAIVSKRQYKSHIGIIDTLKILIDETKPVSNTDALKVIISETKPDGSHKLGKNNPIIVRALMKVIIDDTEYEISCIMDYLKDLKIDTKRLEEIEKYDKKRLATKSENKQNYYLNGMKILFKGNETVDNYMEVLNSHRNIIKERNEHINKLFAEIKTIKKLKV